MTDIFIAKEFSEFPVGRFDEDGDFNGTKFRRQILLPKLLSAIRDDKLLTVHMDGLKSCGSSFLESAFGGLVREDGVAKSKIKRHLVIKSSSSAHQRFIIAANRYILKASKD